MHYKSLPIDHRNCFPNSYKSLPSVRHHADVTGLQVQSSPKVPALLFLSGKFAAIVATYSFQPATRPLHSTPPNREQPKLLFQLPLTWQALKLAVIFSHLQTTRQTNTVLQFCIVGNALLLFSDVHYTEVAHTIQECLVLLMIYKERESSYFVIMLLSPSFSLGGTS